MHTFSAHKTTEARLLRFSAGADRVTALEAFEGTQKPRTESKDKLEAIVAGRKKSTAAIDGKFEKTVGKLRKGYIFGDRGLDAVNTGTVKRKLSAELGTQATERAKLAETTMNAGKGKALKKIARNFSTAERKLAVAAARVEVCADMIADIDKEIAHYEGDAEAMTELAEILGKEGVRSGDLKKKAMLKGIMEELQTEATEAYEALRNKEFGVDAVDEVGKIMTHLEAHALKNDPTALFYLEEVLYDNSAFGPKETNKRIDKMPLNQAEKDMLKSAVARLSSKDLKGASQFKMGGMLKDRLVHSKDANERPTNKERAEKLTTMKRGQRVQFNISGTRRQFVIATPNAESRYTYLLDANGRYASIDRREDGGKLHLTYYKNAKDKKAISIAMEDNAPHVLKEFDPTMVYMSATNGTLATAP